MLKSGTVYLVGAGPGDPGLITWRGLEILRAADSVVYDRLASPELLLQARADARLHYVGKAASNHALTQSEINQLLVDEAKAGRSVCRLKGGDPYLFGRGGEEADYLLENGLDFEVVPGVTSAIAVPAYAGIPVTDRRAGSTVAIATGHEDAEKTESQIDWRGLSRSADTIVVLMGVRNLREITQEFLAAGRDAATPAAVVRWGTTGKQQTVISVLSDIADEVERRRLTPPAILVVGQVVGLSKRLDWFGKRPLIGMRVLVTRPRHQTEALAALLREAGAEPVVCSLIRVEPLLVDAERLRQALSRRWDWCLFTSANGVSCFGMSLRQAGLDWRAMAGARIGAMGPGTAAEVERRELRVDFTPSRAIAENLAAELPDVAPGTRILLARAEEAREALPELLRARGAQVEIIPVYRTVQDERGAAAAASALAAGEVDAITFTSASTVRQLVAAAGAQALGGRLIVSIGPVTSAAVHDHGLSVDVEATEHTIPGLVAALVEHARQQKRSGA
jgi:uroporphyrinogen III methyltransferase/synthase